MVLVEYLRQCTLCSRSQHSSSEACDDYQHRVPCEGTAIKANVEWNQVMLDDEDQGDCIMALHVEEGLLLFVYGCRQVLRDTYRRFGGQAEPVGEAQSSKMPGVLCMSSMLPDLVVARPVRARVAMSHNEALKDVSDSTGHWVDAVLGSSQYGLSC
ncbi:hypothetical protein M409DRAFT_48424 [Zasmidium cellare ATCC 36951]|uniref:Uncharacterized protein n=1 Tax=Zasmidium cellare ATCC 36951 TaxID=1080233 RepID=A0A6A6D739_ZASCE|nr:uncharacterized protein M409DRAFT_48424 [Zasmidium cellare ATCC 36951]KAF2173446.1 hypothetical protein M409DRAFT_48424 [Zasmidium cellare ATCC 36951]